MNKNNKKNKTVKELNVLVEELNTEISSLEVELRIIQSKLKEMFNKKDNRMVQTQSTNTRVIENKLTCNQCDIKFKTQSEMTLHLNEKHKTQYKCEICEYEGTTLISMESHIISEHKSENILKCNDCEKSFVSEICLKNIVKCILLESKYNSAIIIIMERNVHMESLVVNLDTALLQHAGSRKIANGNCVSLDTKFSHQMNHYQ